MTGDEAHHAIDNRLGIDVGLDLCVVVLLGVGGTFLHATSLGLVTFRLDQQVTLHFQMQCRAELGAVVRIDTGLVGNKGGRCRLARLNRELDILTVHGETVNLILGTLKVGQVNLNGITLCTSMISGVMCERIVVP